MYLMSQHFRLVSHLELTLRDCWVQGHRYIPVLDLKPNQNTPKLKFKFTLTIVQDGDTIINKRPGHGVLDKLIANEHVDNSARQLSTLTHRLIASDRLKPWLIMVFEEGPESYCTILV
jgi:hypothetical protein